MHLISKILDFEILSFGKYELKIYSLLFILIVYVATKVLLWLIKKAIFSKGTFHKLEESNAFALFQIIRYVIWVISIALILEVVGLHVTVLLAGSAALLVGVGLGLQQTFNDFISGLILLIEGTTKIGDVLEVDGDIIQIQHIGLRTSKGLNRNNIMLIIPNSLITVNRVINWSHQSEETRFSIDVGVAYTSNVELVIKVLEESVLEHPDIMKKETIEARLVNFGNSSLDFQVLFFSKNVFRIERVKSDIRRIINRKFLEQNINIPFPQVDVHLKTNNL
jgi:small-conductance mechanosensitive channel